MSKRKKDDLSKLKSLQHIWIVFSAVSCPFVYYQTYKLKTIIFKHTVCIPSLTFNLPLSEYDLRLLAQRFRLGRSGVGLPSCWKSWSSREEGVQPATKGWSRRRLSSLWPRLSMLEAMDHSMIWNMIDFSCLQWKLP